MADQIFFLPQQPILPTQEQNRIAKHGPRRVRQGTQTDEVPFDNVLKKEITSQNKVNFSGHAQQRLRSRNIQISQEQLTRMADGVERAAAKGARDSLLLVDNIAAVVSVENRTVVTVVNSDALNDNVFTNIDSAVIA